MGIKQTLANFMREPAYNPMDLEELIAIFDIKKNEYTAFKKILRMMESEGIIKKTKRNKYMIADGVENHDKDEADLVIGILQAHPKGFGFLIPEEEGQKDVFIPSNCMNGAFNGDRISVRVVGVYEDSKNFGFVVSEDTRMSQDIFISKKDRNSAEDGDVVVVKTGTSKGIWIFDT